MSWSQHNDLSAIWYKWLMLKVCAFAYTFMLHVHCKWYNIIYRMLPGEATVWHGSSKYDPQLVYALMKLKILLKYPRFF